MTSQEFVIWLKGFVAGSNNFNKQLTNIIKQNLFYNNK